MIAWSSTCLEQSRTISILLSLSLYKYSVHVLKDILCDLVHSVPDDRYSGSRERFSV